MAQTNKPKVIVRNDGDEIVTEIEHPQRFADRIGHDLFAAFLKCFRGVDQMRSLEAFMKLEADTFRDKRLCSVRMGPTLGFLMISTCYEMGEALNELRACKIIDKISDRAKWTPINVIAGKWYKEKHASMFRNQFGAHLGKRPEYQRGLAIKLAEAGDTLELERGDGPHAHDWATGLATDTLLAGNGIENEGVDEILTRCLDTHTRLPTLLEMLWLDVLATADIEIVNRLSD